jgi:hypothetical protein
MMRLRNANKNGSAGDKKNSMKNKVRKILTTTKK